VVNGFDHSCALFQDGVVKCWGANSRGQLGYGDALNRGDVPGAMGDNLPAIALGTNRTAITIAAGGSHTCAILDDESLKCWGANGNGELGQGIDTSCHAAQLDAPCRTTSAPTTSITHV
jgi:alpha-tubulin suppressor-like RCC1 family protein